MKRDVASRIRYSDFLEQTPKIAKITLTQLALQSTITFHTSPPKLSTQRELYRTFLSKLLIIEQEFGVKFSLPEVVDFRTFANVLGAVDVITTGRVSMSSGPFANYPGTQPVPLEVNRAYPLLPQVVSDFKQNGAVTYVVEEEVTFIVDLLEHSIELGKVEYVFANAVIVNAEEVEAAINNSSDESSPISLLILPDWDESYIHFLSWPRSS
jgi:hypothetical protein